MVVAHMGNILITILTSSTSVKVEIYHFSLIVIALPLSMPLIAALSKKLFDQNVYQLIH